MELTISNRLRYYLLRKFIEDEIAAGRTFYVALSNTTVANIGSNDRRANLPPVADMIICKEVSSDRVMFALHEEDFSAPTEISVANKIHYLEAMNLAKSGGNYPFSIFGVISQDDLDTYDAAHTPNESFWNMIYFSTFFKAVITGQVSNIVNTPYNTISVFTADVLGSYGGLVKESDASVNLADIETAAPVLVAQYMSPALLNYKTISKTYYDAYDVKSRDMLVYENEFSIFIPTNINSVAEVSLIELKN